MIKHIQNSRLKTVARSDRRFQKSKDGIAYKFDRLTPPEEVVWLRLPNFAEIKKLWQGGELMLPRTYRPGMYLNVIV